MNNVYQTGVVIAGAGPTGLWLACELRIAGVEVVLLDALSERSGQSRAGGIGPRTMEVLDQRGLLDRVLPHGRQLLFGHFAGLPMNFSDFATRYPRGLAITQEILESRLDCCAAELGAPVHWDSPVVAAQQDADGITVEIGGSDPRRVRAGFLIGCDGGRSTVRKLAGIEFTGTEATMLGMVADVELTRPPAGFVLTTRGGPGDYSVFELQPGVFRVMVQRHDRVLDPADRPDLEDLRESFRLVAGTDFGMHSARWVSQFGDAARLADTYRSGRILLAGDAAHVHYPAGGQGLNTGIQDAANLGWKLAQVLGGTAASALLDSYEAERRPVAARVLRNTKAQTALMRPGPHTDALRATLAGLFDIDEVRERIGHMMFALDIRYDVGCGHPLAGYRVPDMDLTVAGRPIRLFELLHAGRPVLLSLNGYRLPDYEGESRVEHVEAGCTSGQWSIPGAGDIPAPTAVLIRPDGHIAWAGHEDGTAGLAAALDAWCGQPGRESESQWAGTVRS